MKKKIKVWIVSDRLGTCIYTSKPNYIKETGIYACKEDTDYVFKVDNSKHLYPTPKEMYFCIEQPSKKTKKSKPWCFIRERKNNFEESMNTIKKISSMKQFKKRFPKYHDFRLVDTNNPYYDFDESGRGGWKHNYAVVATTNNKEQRDDIIAYVSNTSVFDDKKSSK